MNEQTNYITVPNESDFWYNLERGVSNVFDAWENYIEVSQKQALGEVLTNPNTPAGSIYTTGQALTLNPESYNKYVFYLFILIIVFLLLYR